MLRMTLIEHGPIKQDYIKAKILCITQATLVFLETVKTMILNIDTVKLKEEPILLPRKIQRLSRWQEKIQLPSQKEKDLTRILKVSFKK